MAQVGTFVTASETPAVTITPFNTAAAFIVGYTDAGPVGTPVQITSLTQFASTFGTPSATGNPYSSRTSTCAVMFDAVETFFREGGGTAFISRVVGTSPVAATLVANNNSSTAALTFTAASVGAGGNGIFVAINNTGSAYVVTLQDAVGNVLAVSPSLSTGTAGVTWAATTGLVTAVAGTSLPITLAATALTGGTDAHGSATLSNFQTALAAFLPSLGPGQVLAPGITNTTLNGIWSALGLHAQNNNRVALCDMDDGVAASVLTAAIASFNASGVAGECGFWGGNLNIPGVVPGTSRTVAPSSVIAGLCARVDSTTGNSAVPAAGSRWAPQFATASTTLVTGNLSTYSNTDLYTLNGSGINTFANRLGRFENYGFVAAVLPTADGIYWQFNHARLRMALIAQGQIIGEPFVFSLIDGQGLDQLALKTSLSNMLLGYYNAGALYGATPSDAFSVDVSANVNTPTTIAAGQLNAAADVRMTGFAQTVNINFNAVPITQQI